MTIAQNSVLVRFFAGLWALLCSGWDESVLRRLFARIGVALRRGVTGSRLCQFVWREGTLPKYWSVSITCRVLTTIINLPVIFAQWIYKIGKNLFDGSIAFRFASAAGGASFLFVGFSMLIILIVPHASWDNVYALCCIILVFLLFWVGAMARPKHRLELTTLGPYFALFLGFIVYAFLSSLGTDFSSGVAHGLSSSLSLRFLVFYIIAFLITLMVVSAVQKTEQLQLMLAIAVAGLVVASLYGCYQGWQGVDVVPSQQDMILNPNMPGRIYSFFDNPNCFGQILVMLMPFELALLLNAKTCRGRVLALISIAPCLAAIGLTYFRTGWIGLAVAVLVFLALLNWRLLPPFIVLGLAALPFLPESIMNRIFTIGIAMEDSSLQYRFAIYRETTYIIRDYGMRGVGLGTDVMKQVFQLYPPMLDGNYPIHTHNHILQMWIELGVFGAITFLAMVLHQIKAGVKSFYSSTNREAKNILAAAVGALCGISVISVMEHLWFYPRNMFVYFFLFGVIAAAIKLAKKNIA